MSKKEIQKCLSLLLREFMIISSIKYVLRFNAAVHFLDPVPCRSDLKFRAEFAKSKHRNV